MKQFTNKKTHVLVNYVATIDYLKQHVEIVHEEKKPFACQHCDNVFKDKRQLKWHIATTHERK